MSGENFQTPTDIRTAIAQTPVLYTNGLSGGISAPFFPNFISLFGTNSVSSPDNTRVESPAPTNLILQNAFISVISNNSQVDIIIEVAIDGVAPPADNSLKLLIPAQTGGIFKNDIDKMNVKRGEKLSWIVSTGSVGQLESISHIGVEAIPT